MKYLVVIFCLALYGCDNSLPKSGKKLDQDILLRTERFVPTEFGFNLLEIVVDTSDIESPRYLYLFDDQNKYIDGIRLYGTVQKIEKGRIEINKSLSGRTGEGRIGDIIISYPEIKKVSKGGIFDGSYLLENIVYDKKTKVVSLKLLTSDTTYIWNETEINEKSKFYTDSLTMNFNIAEINFNPHYKMEISYTGWDSSGTYNLTKGFYFSDKRILNKFYIDLEKNGL